QPKLEEELLLEQAAEKLGRGESGFLPPMYHQIVAWVGLWIENDGRPRQKRSWYGDDEVAGLHALFETLSTYKDFGLIHHNGRGFDLPVIMYRTLKHELQMPHRLSHHDIKYRYSKQNVDLIDEFSNYGASSWPKLEHLSHLIDMPVKQTGHGDQVPTLYRKNQLQEVEHYCHEDVMGTYIIWLHLKYTVGDITKSSFDNLKERATDKLKELQTE
ncbi:MAG TPA: ribonuclease H-like domain-containing protein, partial [Fodinibius sp.]|nr:ribonuclease H-like domain-containing protein [Fodinibius sp.]